MNRRRNMVPVLRYLLCFQLLLGVAPLIVPDDLTDSLNLLYANLPPVKTGTDSRLGFGFALGRHADVQVLLELGPQVNKEPLAGGASQRRRQTTDTRTAGNTVRPSGSWLQRMVATLFGDRNVGQKRPPYKDQQQNERLSARNSTADQPPAQPGPTTETTANSTDRHTADNTTTARET